MILIIGMIAGHLEGFQASYHNLLASGRGNGDLINRDAVLIPDVNRILASCGIAHPIAGSGGSCFHRAAMDGDNSGCRCSGCRGSNRDRRCSMEAR